MRASTYKHDSNLAYTTLHCIASPFAWVLRDIYWLNAPHHTTSYHTSPHHTTLHYTTPHHTTPHHTTPHSKLEECRSRCLWTSSSYQEHGTSRREAQQLTGTSGCVDWTWTCSRNHHLRPCGPVLLWPRPTLLLLGICFMLRLYRAGMNYQSNIKTVWCVQELFCDLLVVITAPAMSYSYAFYTSILSDYVLQNMTPLFRSTYHLIWPLSFIIFIVTLWLSQVRALQTAFRSNTIPPEILQTLLNLAEFMEHDVEALPISLSILAELAQKGICSTVYCVLCTVCCDYLF